MDTSCYALLSFILNKTTPLYYKREAAGNAKPFKITHPG
jgi:hypothetical protein